MTFLYTTDEGVTKSEKGAEKGAISPPFYAFVRLTFKNLTDYTLIVLTFPSWQISQHLCIEKCDYTACSIQGHAFRDFTKYLFNKFSPVRANPFLGSPVL